MSKINDTTIDRESSVNNEYKYIDENKSHLHTYLGKALLGTSTVTGVLAKPLTWWASGLACEKLGWMNKGNAKKGWTPKEDRIKRAGEYQEMIGKLPVESYLDLLDDAYKAHSVKLETSAGEGTDMHALMEGYIKDCMSNNDGVPLPREVDNKNLQNFINWCILEVDKFLWSELHCYSNRLWVGGISDVGLKLKNGKSGILDFKSSKESYTSQFIQCAGYDIEISENGGFNAEGYKMFELENELEFYAIIPFGAEEFTVDFRFNVDELKKGFESCVCLYKLINI